ncbi:hypothetical protein E2C01_066309 [Portunus trituberculatus]|uniref:Uncharacterized protein n=1 Tax=Portunus trituberculatus TaxID=210409 RepID=A0A5B7HRZ9_PORTR|nr:hypothetical protein [Portunus trituberculatus]
MEKDEGEKNQSEEGMKEDKEEKGEDEEEMKGDEEEKYGGKMDKDEEDTLIHSHNKPSQSFPLSRFDLCVVTFNKLLSAICGCGEGATITGEE